MRVLIADDDAFSAAIMERLVTSAGHEAIVVDDGAAAWEVLQAEDPPRIAFLDWMMPGIDGLTLCAQIRGLGRHEYTYVAILSSRNKQRDISLGYHAGADDFLTKPFTAAEVLSRLRVAGRLIRSVSGQSSLRAALDEACNAAGGDVIVRSGGRVGRVLFHQGLVAWAHLSDEPGSLQAMLAGEPAISADEVTAVLEECSETGQGFADVIVAWGLLTHARLREVIGAWIRDKITGIAALPAPRVIFSPAARKTSSDMLFRLEEVAAPSLLTALDEDGQAQASNFTLVPEVDAATRATIGASLDRAILIEGALSAAVFDLRSGLCLGARGQAVDVDVVWSKLRLATMSELWGALEDILLTTSDHIYLLRPYTRDPPRMIFLVIDRAVTKIGMVRRAIAECTEVAS